MRARLYGSVSAALAQTVDQGEGFVASRDFAVELGVADLFEQRGELRAGREAVAIRSPPSTSGGGLSRSGGQASRSRQNASGRIVGTGDRFVQRDQLGGAVVR